MFKLAQKIFLFTHFYISMTISPQSCGKEEKFGKLTENISTIRVTTFAMVFLWPTLLDDMWEKLSVNQRSSTNIIAITVCSLRYGRRKKLNFIALNRGLNYISTKAACTLLLWALNIKMLNAERLLLSINIIANWPPNFYICFTFHLLLWGETYFLKMHEIHKIGIKYWHWNIEIWKSLARPGCYTIFTSSLRENQDKAKLC